MHINNKKSTDIYTELNTLLCSLFNKIFSEGFFPDYLKLLRLYLNIKSVI